MASLIRLLAALIASFTGFLVGFLAVFVPMLVSDMHYARYDGQGGMGGAFLGLPVGALTGVIAGIYFYSRAKRQNWPSIAK